MNKKIILSVLTLPVSAIIAFIAFVIVIAILGSASGDPNFFDNIKTNPAEKIKMGYFLFGGAGLLYILSLLFIWRRKSETSTSVQAQPWNYFAVFIMSSLFGPGAAYLISWQNLLRMGKIAEAKQFLLFGGAIFLLMSVGFFLLPEGGTKLLGNVASIAFPIWLYYAHQKQWQISNPNKAKFSWSILGWSLLGVILVILVFLLLGFIIRK